jgi:hypothetical protein
MASAAALGWGIDQAAKTEDYVFRMEDIAGTEHDDINHAKFRKLLQDFQVTFGYDIDSAGKAALSSLRQFQGVPGGGVDTLEEILGAGAVEARRKGASLEESVESGIGLAHQFRTYDPQGIRELMANFAALSTADPRSLTSMKRASGYAVPTLSQIGVDPSSVLLAGTALARAGVDSTKSGTWIREAVTRAMPGIVLGHSASNKKHEEALRALHLVDESGKPTWYNAEGRPDIFKLLSTSSDALQGMSPQDRAAYGRAAFGAQGFGAISVLGDPQVNAQMHALDDLTKSPAYRERYKNFNADYSAGSTMQDARRGLAELNVTLGELARNTLPSINVALRGFSSALEKVRSFLPGGPEGNGKIGGAALLGGVSGAATGAAVGAVGGPIGWLGGAAIGGGVGAAYGIAPPPDQAKSAIADSFSKFFPSKSSSADSSSSNGGVAGVAEGFLEGYKAGIDKGGSYTSPGKTGKPAEKIVVTPPVNLSLNVDGTTLARVLGSALQSYYQFSTGAAAADGAGQSFGGGHNTTDQ